MKSPLWRPTAAAALLTLTWATDGMTRKEAAWWRRASQVQPFRRPYARRKR